MRRTPQDMRLSVWLRGDLWLNAVNEARAGHAKRLSMCRNSGTEVIEANIRISVRAAASAGTSGNPESIVG